MKLKWLILFLLVSSNAFAWNALGHMVVADIAYQQLNSDAIKKINALVKTLNSEYKYIKTFDQMSVWADSLRKQKIELFSHWHYINLGFSLDDTPIKNTIDADNCVWVISKIKIVMQNKHVNFYERARFLAFLIHTVGDIHQPLHTTTLFSAAHPDSDKGGNYYQVIFQGKTQNLHKLWDEGLGVFNGEFNDNHAHEIANSIMNDYPKSYFGNKIDDLNEDDWAKEGLSVAKKYVYITPENKSVDENYITSSQQISEQQAALAGYRLGKLLNQLFS